MRLFEQNLGCLIWPGGKTFCHASHRFRQEHNFSVISSCCYMSLHLKSLCDLEKECHQKLLFAFVFDHERSSRTVKTTRVLGCNQRNRKRIGRERGKIAFSFCKIVFGSPESWLPKLWMKELEERKLGQQTAAVALDEVPLWQWYGWALHQWSTVQVC